MNNIETELPKPDRNKCLFTAIFCNFLSLICTRF